MDFVELEYRGTESYAEFLQQVAQKYFPQAPEVWLQRYHFILQYYGKSTAACKGCQGQFNHHGHKFVLRIKKGTSLPVPCAREVLCPCYKPPQRVMRQQLPPDLEVHIPDERTAPFAPPAVTGEMDALF